MPIQWQMRYPFLALLYFFYLKAPATNSYQLLACRQSLSMNNCARGSTFLPCVFYVSFSLSVSKTSHFVLPVFFTSHFLSLVFKTSTNGFQFFVAGSQCQGKNCVQPGPQAGFCVHR